MDSIVQLKNARGGHMKNWFRNFMAGRTGPDNLGKFLLIVSFAIVLLSYVLGMFSAGTVSNILWLFGLVSLFYCYFRMMSRNIYKRQEENRKFLRRKAKIKAWFNSKTKRFKQRKTHRYFKCPNCKAQLRVPKGKGKIKISCNKCGHTFVKKT